MTRGKAHSLNLLIGTRAFQFGVRRYMDVIVRSLHWLSEEAREATIQLNSSGASIIAFSCPCAVEVGDQIGSPLHAFNSRNIRIIPGDPESITNTKGLACAVTGVLVDQHSQIVQSCGFNIRIEDYLPGGIEQGNTVSFECGRVDVW